MTRASVSTICGFGDAHLARQHVVVEPLEHRDERERGDDRVEVLRRGGRDALGEDAREAEHHVVAHAAELVRADLRFGPGPDHRAVALVEVGEPADPRLELGAALGARRERAEVLGERLHLVRDLGHERAEQVFLVGEVQVEGAVRRLGELDDVVDARRVVAARSRTPRHPRRAASQRALARGPAARGSASGFRPPARRSPGPWRPGGRSGAAAPRDGRRRPIRAHAPCRRCGRCARCGPPAQGRRM